MPTPPPEESQYSFSVKVLLGAASLVLIAAIACLVTTWPSLTGRDLFLLVTPLVCGGILIALAISNQKRLRDTRRALRVSFEAVFRKRSS